MSFKSEAASVRAGLSSGSFMKKVDPFKGFFEELSYGLKKQDEEKRQEERVKRQEARAIGRATKAKQDAADTLAKKIETNAVRLANQFAGSDAGSNAKVIDYFRQNLIATDNDYNGTVTATTDLLNSNQLSFTPQQVGTELLSISGADLNQPPAQRPTDESPIKGGIIEHTTWNNSTQAYDGEERPLTSEDLRRIANGKGDDGRPHSQAALAQQMLDLELSDAKQDALYAEKNYEEVPVFGETQVNLEPYKKPRFDTSLLRKDNWEGTYQRIVNDPTRGESDPDALDIKAWAVGQEFFKVAGGYTRKQLMALPVNGDGEKVGLDTVLNTSVLTEAEVAIVEAIKTVKKAEEIDSNIFNDPDELILKSVSDLSAYASVHAKDTKFGKNIRIALSRKEALANSSNLQALSQELDKGVEWYDAAMKVQGVLDENDPFYERNVASLKNLIILRGLALEKVNKNDLEAEQKLTTKERFLKAVYKEKGFFIVGEDGESIKIPDSAAMASIENTWKKLTDITEKPNWYEDDKLLQLSVEDLKVIIDTGILTEQADVLQLVQDMYNSRVKIAEDTKLSELLDPTGRTWNSTTEVDAFVAAAGPEVFDTPEKMTSFTRVRAVLAKAEGLIAEGEDINTYQVALKAHLALPENTGKTGQELIDVMTNWETTWKDQSAKTPDAATFNAEFVAGEIFKANQNIKSGDPTLEAEGQKFLKDTLPSMIAGLVGVNNTSLNQQAKLQFLLDSGVDEAFARATVGGTTEIVADPITGDRTVVNFDSFSASAPEEIQTPVAEIAANITQLSQTGFKTIVNGEEITVSREDLLESQAFMDREKTPGGNLDVRKAFGSGAFLKWAASNTTALVGLETFPELIQMQTYIKGLNNAAMRSISVAIEGSRDSVMNKNLILDNLPKAATLFESKTEAKQKLKGTVSELRRQMDVLQLTLDGRTTPTAKSKAFIQLNALKPLYESYGNLYLAWHDAETKAKVTVTPGLNITETVTATKPVSNNELKQTSTSEDGTPIYTFGGNN